MKNENVSEAQYSCEGRILLVDTDKDLVLKLKSVLETCGYQVEVAYSAQHSLEKIKTFDAEVVLIGICPEDMDGIDLIACFKAVRPHILYVMIAESDQAEKVLTKLERGAYDYLPKPVDRRYLSVVLGRCFEKLHLEQQQAKLKDTLNVRNQELQEVNDRLKTIARSTRSLASCSDIEEINRRLLEEFARNMAAEGGSLYLVKQDALILAHTLDPGHAPSRIPFPLREGSVFANVLSEKHPILVKDIEQENGLLKSGWTGYRNGALLVFPLAGTAGDIQGLLTLHNRTYPPFTSQDREIGTILASYSYEVLRATHALEELRASEERYRRIFDNIQDVYYETLLDGTIIEVSPSVISISGYTRAELLNTSVRDLYANPDERADFLEQIRQQGRVSDYEIHLQNKNGVVAPCALAACLLFDKYGSPWKICGSLRDITERKLAEQEVQQLNTELEGRVQQRTAELERANQELRHFVHAASHDLKTPLHGISKMASWLREDYAGVLDEEGQAHILRIINRVNRLDMLIEGMLEYSSIGRAPLKMEQIDLNLLVQNVIRTIAPPENIQVLIESPLPVIIGNALHLRQVFSHVLENAVIFMDKPEGKVTINCVDDGKYWRFFIRDTGRGIDGKYYMKIFRIFQTLQRRDEHESAGIGLALVKKIVEDVYGGAIWVESEIGQGSTFFFTLPKDL